MEARMQQQLNATAEAIVRRQEARQAQREQHVVLEAEGRFKALFDLQQAELQAVRRAQLASHREDFDNVKRAQLQDTKTLEDIGRREGWHRPEQAAERAVVAERNMQVARQRQASHELYLRNEQELAESAQQRNLAQELWYGWIPHNAGFGFLDLALSIRHSNWFWDYIS
jgi:hypothetical protein